MATRPVISYLLIVLLAEKVIQHTAVSLSFLYNIGNIRSTVAVDYEALMIIGAIVAVLFAVALWEVVRRKNRGLYMASLLAAFDIVGEFVAQGTILIVINISIIVAIVLLFLCYFGRQSV